MKTVAINIRHKKLSKHCLCETLILLFDTVGIVSIDAILHAIYDDSSV